MKNEKAKNINIELDEKTAQGQYSNLVVVNHSPTEFVLDFVNIMPGSPKAKVCVLNLKIFLSISAQKEKRS